MGFLASGFNYWVITSNLLRVRDLNYKNILPNCIDQEMSRKVPGDDPCSTWLGCLAKGQNSFQTCYPSHQEWIEPHVAALCPTQDKLMLSSLHMKILLFSGFATAGAGTGGKFYHARLQNHLGSARSRTRSGPGRETVGTLLMGCSSRWWAWGPGLRAGLDGQEVAPASMNMGWIS